MMERKLILEDPSIIWPGTKVEINDPKAIGTILCSYKHGEVYEVQDSAGIVRVLNQTEFKILERHYD
tara:strand:+ start:228 stop:428 length:201 start_codon:yes stop_codon:yes gene_type:complete